VNVTTWKFHYNIVKYKVVNVTTYVVMFTTLIANSLHCCESKSSERHYVIRVCSDVHYFVFTVCFYWETKAQLFQRCVLAAIYPLSTSSTTTSFSYTIVRCLGAQQPLHAFLLCQTAVVFHNSVVKALLIINCIAIALHCILFSPRL